MKKSAFILMASVVMTACSQTPKEKVEIMTSAQSTKETQFVQDNTTEVLVDKEIQKDDIVRVVQHGDHWHIFTKDGKEHITYINPHKSSNTALSLVSVVPLTQLKDMDVVSISVHGDHWHVKTRDGKEYLTYEDPSGLFKQITIGQYQGQHDASTQNGNSKSITNATSSGNSAGNGLDIVKIARHGDHYHVYTRDGQEFVVYSDPRGLYPNAEYAEYSGNHAGNTGNHDDNHDNHDHDDHDKDNDGHGDNDNHDKDNGSQDQHGDHNHDTGDNGGNTGNGNENSDISVLNPPKLNIVKVVSGEFLKTVNIDKILKHGDHYHVYTKDGKEYLSYDKLEHVFPSIQINEYAGSHGDMTPPKIKIPVLAIQHGNHWHLYADLDGKEEIGETQEDPRIKYPTIKIKQDDTNTQHDHSNIDDTHSTQHENEKTPVLAMQYGNIWGLYADEDGDEEIGTMTELPTTKYPNIKLIYEDNVVDTQGDDEIDDHDDEDNTAEKVPVLAKKHGDHWHLYADLEGKKEIGVSNENPKYYYPNIVIEDYQGDHDTNDLSEYKQDDSDRLYASVSGEKIVPLNKPYMHLVAGLIGYASTDNTFGTVYNFGKNVFVIPHIDHYHNLSIQQIEQLVKQDMFEGYSARDVVATFKYYIEHPQERPKKAGWGSQVGIKEDVESSESVEKKIAYLMRVYHISHEQDIQRIGSDIKIWSTNPYTTIALSELIIEDGEVKPLIILPHLPR